MQVPEAQWRAEGEVVEGALPDEYEGLLRALIHVERLAMGDSSLLVERHARHDAVIRGLWNTGFPAVRVP